MAKVERYVVKGLDAWGNPVEEELLFKRLSWFDRVLQAFKRGFRRPRVYSGICVEVTRVEKDEK